MGELNNIIYCHRNKINGKRYIGQTRNLKRRWDSPKNYKCSTLFYHAIQKYGWENFEHIILEICCESNVDERERSYINLYNSNDIRFGYNLEDGGHSCKHLSEETKKKMSENLMGRYAGNKNPMYGIHRFGKKSPHYGHHLSDETKKILSIKSTGNKNACGCVRSEEVKMKISKANSGKKASAETRAILHAQRNTPEHKEKMRQLRLGKHLSEETKRKMSETVAKKKLLFRKTIDKRRLIK